MPVAFPDEAVSLAGDGLNEAGIFGVVFERLADFADGGVDAVLGIDEDILAPDAVDDFLTGDDGSILFHQKQEQFHGDALQFQDAAFAAEFEARGVELKIAKLVGRCRQAELHRSPETIALMPLWA